jgi:hypothetical protein
MEREILVGRMEKVILENILMIKNKGLVYSNMEMVKNMKGSGKMENSMDKVAFLFVCVLFIIFFFLNNRIYCNF